MNIVVSPALRGKFVDNEKLLEDFIKVSVDFLEKEPHRWYRMDADGELIPLGEVRADGNRTVPSTTFMGIKIGCIPFIKLNGEKQCNFMMMAEMTEDKGLVSVHHRTIARKK